MVIAILGILSAVAIPNVVGLMNSGETESALAEQGTIALAVSVYAYQHEGAIPSNVQALIDAGLFQQSPQYDWNIDGETGEVSPGTDNPLYE